MKKIETKKIIRIKLNALLTRVVNECIKKNIDIVKIVYRNNFVEADINYSDRGRFAELCLKNNWEYKNIKKYGVVNSVHETIKRTGIVLAILVSICTLIIMQNFTVNFEVIGESGKETSEIIEKFLGKKYMVVDEKVYRELESALSEVEGIANVNVYRKGLYVFVEIKEELVSDSIVEDAKNKTVTSKYDAIVTRIITLSGTPLVARDARVKKGQILIDGYYIFQENKLETYAKGEVYGKVYRSEKTTIMKEKTTVKRTGKKEVFTTVLMPNKKIDITSFMQKCTFDNYDVEVTETKLKNILPLSLINVTAYETETITEIAEEKSLSATAMAMIEQFVIVMGSEGILLDSFYKITDIGSAYTIDVFAEFETRIA